MMLQDKKILFIAPIFHDYHILIINKLQELGAIVSFFPERDYSIYFKIVNNFFNPFLIFKQKLHYCKILKQVKKQHFDYLFVIRGYMMPKDFVKTFKKYNPLAKTIMYQWDSNRANPFSKLITLFDVVKSFDYSDCERFRIKYLPLFYTDDVTIEASRIHEIKYDFFFMGTYMPERYNAVLRFRDSLPKNYTLKAFIYIPPSSFKKEQIKGTKLDMSIVSTQHMSREEYLITLNQSKVIVDVSNPLQTGLAMRIIEALASYRKVLTVNSFILDDPYYTPQNIAVFDVNNPIIDRNFINTPFCGSINVLSIHEWILSIFDFDK